MKIAGATLTRVRLRLRVPIATGRGLLAVREGAVLALRAESGEVGYGEALPLDGFGSESVEAACDALDCCYSLWSCGGYELPRLDG